MKKSFPNRATSISGMIGGDQLAANWQAFRLRKLKLQLRSPLPKEDPEAVEVVHKQFESEGIRVLIQTKVEVEIADRKKYLWAGQKVVVDEILVAAGRQPNVESLNLDVVKLGN